MTVGIISDLHDNLINFNAFLDKTGKDIDELWIAGDVGTPDTLSEICAHFTKTIRTVAGNVEIDHNVHRYTELLQTFSHLFWGDDAPLVWEARVGDKQLSVAMFHKPDEVNKYISSNHPNIVVCGHTHRPDLKRDNSAWIVNPGTLGGVYYPATYTLADLSRMQFELKRLY